MSEIEKKVDHILSQLTQLSPRLSQLSDEVERSRPELSQLSDEMERFRNDVLGHRIWGITEDVADAARGKRGINVELVESFMDMLRRCGDGGPNATLTLTKEFAADLYGNLVKLGVPTDGDAP